MEGIQFSFSKHLPFLNKETYSRFQVSIQRFSFSLPPGEHWTETPQLQTGPSAPE
jgi:hypothetical protein